VTDVQLQLPFEELLVEPQFDYEGIPYFEDPQNDNEILLNLQYQYKVNKNKNALAEFYRLGFETACKYVSKAVNTRRQFKELTMAQRTEKAQDAITYIIANLIRKPGWFITDSCTGYLYLRVEHELKYMRKVDKIVDFVDFDTFYKEGDEDEED